MEDNIRELWDHQAEAVCEVVKHFENGRKRVLLSGPTGAGKSTACGAVIKCMKARAVVTTHKINLTEQMRRELSDAFAIPVDDIGIMQGANTTAGGERIVVATAQTIASRGFPQGYDLLVIDEAHRRYKSVLGQIGSQPTLGLTATPYAVGMEDDWEELVTMSCTSDLIKNGTLVRIRPFRSKNTINTAGLAYDRMSGDYGSANDIEKRTTDEVISGAIDHWTATLDREYGRVVPTIMFTRSIAHGKTLCDAFNAAGHEFRQIHSGDDPRERADHIESFRRGEIIGLASCDVLAEGFDVREVGCVLNARPTRSIIRLIQSIGRGMRSCEGKKDAVYIDLTDSFANEREYLISHWMHGPQEIGPLKPKKNGVAPMKSCPECGYDAVRVGAAECPQCGYKFPPSEPREKKRRYEEIEEDEWVYLNENELDAACRSAAAKMRSPRTRMWETCCYFVETRHNARDAEHAYRIAHAKWKSIENFMPFAKHWHPKEFTPVDPGRNGRPLMELMAREFAAWKSRL